MPENGIVRAAALLAALILGGCGDSSPISPRSAAAPASVTTSLLPAAPGPRFGGSETQWGRFAPVSPDILKDAARVDGCNLDAIYNAPPGGAPLQRNVKVLFAGWLADPAAGMVPARFGLVLRGVRAYMLQVRGGGQERPDVAAHFDNPDLARAGFRIMADLSAVTPGQYAVVFEYDSRGRGIECDPGKKIAIR